MADLPLCPDLGPLAGSPRLPHLSLRSSRSLPKRDPVRLDLSPLAEIPTLEFLDLGNSMTCADLSPLARLSKLRVLHIYDGSALQTLDGLAEGACLQSFSQIRIHPCPQLEGTRPPGLDADIDWRIKAG